MVPNRASAAPGRRRWPRLEAENAVELLAYFATAPCAERHASAAVTWVVTGVDSNDHNGVLGARFTPAEADRQVPALVARFRDGRVPALWCLDPASRPADLADRLTRLGCPPLRPGVGMAAALHALPDAAMPVPPGLTVDRATAPSDLADWMDVWTGGARDTERPRERLYASLGLDGPRPLRHYVARWDGRPVGVSQLFLGRRAAGLYCVAVLPAFRRRGVGAALTLTPLRRARALGASVAVLGPSAEGEPLYRRLGFERFASPFAAHVLWYAP